MTDVDIERADGIRDDKRLIASIVYLSSLASESKTVDPMLDTLRSVTARWDLKAPLSENDRTSLQKLIMDLKYYLVHRDPLRSFTIEELDERLTEELEGNNEKLSSFVSVWISCMAVAVAIFILPFPLSDVNRMYISITVLLTVLTGVTVWLYLSSLRQFNDQLRRVFVFICIGAGLLVVTCLHYTLIGILGVTDYPIFRYGGATEIALLAIVALYVGMSKYATLLKLATSTIAKQLVVSLVATVLLAVLVVYVRDIGDKLFFGISFVAILATGFCAFFGAKMTRRVIGVVTPSYAKSLQYLNFFLVGVFVTALAFIVTLIWQGQVSVGALSILIAFIGIPTMTLFMYSGYSFKKETNR